MRVPQFSHRGYTPKRLAAEIVMLVALWAAAAFCATGSARAEALEILTPPPGKTVHARNPFTHLVLRQPEEAGETRVKPGKGGKALKPVVSLAYDGQAYLHFRLELSSGRNSFTILPTGREFDVVYRKIHAKVDPRSLGKNAYLFHGGGELPEACGTCHELVETERAEPLGLRKAVSCASCHKNIEKKGPWKHSTTVNKQCLACHQQSDYPLRIGFPDTESAETCMTCHASRKQWFEKKYIHGPLRVGGCTLCHDPHGERNRYQLWAEGSWALCISCHSDKRDLVGDNGKRPFVHGIIYGAGCTACHDPHASDHEFMLEKPINELCTGCHPSLVGVKRGHPVSGHPVSAPREFLRSGRELTCASCHDPHGAWHRNLLIETVEEARLCYACHDK